MPAETAMGQAGTVMYRPKDPLVPLSNLQRSNEIDEVLRPVLKARRREVHAAIETVLKGWPGRKRAELWALLRRLRNGHRGAVKCHAIWNEEDMDILRAYYAQGRAGARRAVKELLARHPDWSAWSVWYKAAKLGISTLSEKPRAWSREEQGVLLWNAGEKPVEKIARKLGRSEQAVRQMLSSRGVASKVRIPKNYTLHRVSKLLGVSDAIVRLWFRKGLFGEPASQRRNGGRFQSGPRLSAAALATFCETHPGKINTERCDPDFLVLIEDKNVQPPGWDGSRQHLAQRRSCPGCGDVIRGNAYFRHVKRCTAGPAPASKLEAQSVANRLAVGELKGIAVG